MGRYPVRRVSYGHGPLGPKLLPLILLPRAGIPLCWVACGVVLWWPRMVPLSLTLPTPLLRGTYFGSTSSVPKMDPSPPTLRIMARSIYRTVLPAGLRPRLPIHRRPLSSGVYSLFSGTQASSHELNTIAALPCPFSSTLDRTRVP